MQVVVFFDVAARLCAGDGPIAELAGRRAPLDRSCAETNASKLLFRLPFCLTTNTWRGVVCLVSVLYVRNCHLPGTALLLKLELIFGQAFMHPSLITLHSARDDPSGGRCPAQIPQLDTSQASKESHNSIHNRLRTQTTLASNNVCTAQALSSQAIGCTDWRRC